MKEFDKIIGYEEIKLELQRMQDIIVNIDKYSKFGVTMPHGLLLHGEPGLGKTLMAQCFIEACNVPTYTVRKNKSTGDFLEEINSAFKNASKQTPAIVFLDDMDKFANEDSYHRDADEYVTIQSCIDTYSRKGIFVLATANHLDDLPRSLLRVGRFDKCIEVRAPKIQEAEQIIKYYLAQKSFVGDIDCKAVARILHGESCAVLETVINEAGVYAGSQNKEKIDMDDVIKACMRIIYKAPESISGYSQDALKAIAYHEAGHAVVAEILEPQSVNIVSVCKHDSNVGGITSYYQNEDYFMFKEQMENRVISLMAGRAATEIVFGQTDVGANNDVQRAIKIVERFVDNYSTYGFSNFEHWAEQSNDFYARRENTVYNEMERYYQKARKILIDNRKFLDKLADELMVKQTLTAADVQRLQA